MKKLNDFCSPKYLFILVCFWGGLHSLSVIAAEDSTAGNHQVLVTSEKTSGNEPTVIGGVTHEDAGSNSANQGAYLPTAQPLRKSSSTSQLASLIGGLILILGLIFGLSWFVKRFSQGGFMQNSTIKMLSAMPLGTRERLMLVDVGGKQLLLGVTATHINTLHVFDEPVVVAGEKSAANSDFSQKLMAILQQKNLQSTNSSFKDSQP